MNTLTRDQLEHAASQHERDAQHLEHHRATVLHELDQIETDLADVAARAAAIREDLAFADLANALNRYSGELHDHTDQFFSESASPTFVIHQHFAIPGA
jgi:hypothetical protein